MCTERSFPTKRSSSFLPMRHWEVGMSRSSRSSWSFHSGRATVPTSLLIVQLRTSLTLSQSPSPAKSFLTDTDSLASPGSEGGSHLSARTVLSKTWCVVTGGTKRKPVISILSQQRYHHLTCYLCYHLDYGALQQSRLTSTLRPQCRQLIRPISPSHYIRRRRDSRQSLIFQRITI